MKAVGFILLLFLTVQNLYSQEYLNVVLPRNTPHGFSHCADVVENESGLWTMAHQYHPETNNGVSTLVQLTENGDTISSNKITSPVEVTYGARIIKHTDYLFVTALYESFLGDIGRILLVCFNSEGLELWRKVFISDRASSTKTVVSFDNYIYIAGTSYNPNPDLYFPTHFYIIKCAITDGTVIWTKKINPSYYSSTMDMIETSDGNLLVCGWSRRFAWQQLYEMRVVMLDPQGEIIWDKNLGVSSLNNYEGRLVELPDGSFLCTHTTDEAPTQYTGRIFTFDKNGDIINEQTYQYGNMTVFKTPILNDDGTFVVLGSRKNDQNEVVALLTKFDPNLDVVWQRTYYRRDDMPNYTYNISATSDGGYVFCGSAFTYINNYQHAWLVKTDCFGCDSLLCYYEDSTCMVYDCNEYPTNPQFTVSEPVFSTFVGTTFTFTQTETGNTTMRYWDMGDGTTLLGAESVEHTYTQAGTYTVKLRSHHSACYDEYEQTILVTQNVGESYANDGTDKEDEMAHVGLESWEYELKIYPNPAENELFVEFPNTQGTLTMMDMLGKEVLAPIAFDGYALLNLSNLSSGVYVLRLMSGDGQVWNRHVIKN
jgi:PKD repeat protein